MTERPITEMLYLLLLLIVVAVGPALLMAGCVDAQAVPPEAQVVPPATPKPKPKPKRATAFADAGQLYRVVWDDKGELREIRDARTDQIVHLNDMACPDMPEELAAAAEYQPPPIYDGSRRSIEMLEGYSAAMYQGLRQMVAIYGLCAAKRH